MNRRALLPLAVLVFALALPSGADAAQAFDSSVAATAGVDVASASTAHVSGTATDLQGAPKTGLNVYAVRYDSTWTPQTNEGDSPHAVVQADGSFSIDDIPPGLYRFEFSTENQEAQTPDGVEQVYYFWGGSPLKLYGGDPVQLNAGDARTDIDVQIPHINIVSGQVSCSNCDITQLGPTAEMMVGYSALDPATHTWSPTTYTNALWSDYSWQIHVIYPGTYRYLIYTAGDPWIDDWTNPVVVGEGGPSGHPVVQNLSVTKTFPLVTGIKDDGGQPFLYTLYFDFLDRLPADAETRSWAPKLTAGTPRSSVANGFVTSNEYRLDRIDAAYESILGRKAEQNGRLSWLASMRAGQLTTDDIETSLYASNEYFNKQGQGSQPTNTTFVASLYTKLLHRTGSSAEYASWVTSIANHGRAWVVKAFWMSSETIRERVNIAFQHYLGRQPTASELQSWTNVVVTGGDSGFRAGLTSSAEYFSRAGSRYPVEH